MLLLRCGWFPIVYEQLLQGDIIVEVASVDLAGNVDPSPVILSVVVISAAPDTAVTIPPPVLTNTSTVSIAVTAIQASTGFVKEFKVRFVQGIHSMAEFGQAAFPT